MKRITSAALAASALLCAVVPALGQSNQLPQVQGPNGKVTAAPQSVVNPNPGGSGPCVVGATGCPPLPTGDATTQANTAATATNTASAKTDLDIIAANSATMAANTAPFTPSSASAVLLPVTTISASVPLPTGGSTEYIQNQGVTPAHVRLGASSVTAGPNDLLIQPGAGCAFGAGSNTFVAARTDANTTNLVIQSGWGSATCGGGGGSFASLSPQISYSPPPLTAPVAPGTDAGTATVSALAGGTWSMSPTTSFQVNSSTGDVTASSTVPAGTYTPTLTYTDLVSGQTITVSLATNIVVSGAASAGFFFPSATNLIAAAAVF